MTLKINIILAVLAVAAIAGAVLVLSNTQTFASAPSGLPATVSTSTTLVATDVTARILFATSTCAARIITVPGGTGLAGVRLTFNDFQGEIPTTARGVYQAASTTVAYDSGLYGCDLVRAFGYGTQTLYLIETR